MSQDLIRIRAVSKEFGATGWFKKPVGVKAVDGVTLAVKRGQTLGIVGESGSGKSTLLRMALRLIKPSSGTVEIDGQDIWTLQGAELKAFRRKVQPIFQNPASSFNPRQSIGQILVAPLEVHGIGDRDSRRAKVAALLERVGLPKDAIDRHPHQLSGGQKQRIAIARAVILQPEAVLADEPTSALDVSVQAQVLDLFDDIRRDLGLTAIFVSHNLAVIRQVSDQIAVMRHGSVVEYGEADQVFGDPQHEYTKTLIAAVPDHRKLMRAL
ncbi:ATP-binding cassette domain-containing protein [Antarcticimicrobium sediminis]|uniref:ABC transporter ATP-binding protein n=1 Tax=Antarcticimicrobium sediminis TaxID=2546227 RepID=A0A4R5EKE7_9RHOB|nr:ATP-binding cassette domain-containing protein [Antarcticimicrobium sediminis]TDE34932.1 ABC transporter ATP-binding protein [Antarcticimicrobium sediminis]